MQNKFEEDMNCLLTKLQYSIDPNGKTQLTRLKDRLVYLHKKNLVKINHSAMELVCAKQLIQKGFNVEIEYFLDGLTCDLYSAKGAGIFLVEVETGFVPPEHALDPTTYCRARITSKITRYSNHSDKFAIGLPPYYLAEVHPALLESPRLRTAEDLLEIKNLCDLYYSNPPVTLEEVKNARLHTIYIINVDRASAREIDPETYTENKPNLNF